MTNTTTGPRLRCLGSKPPGTHFGWCIPPSVIRFADRLFNQQLWCWGQDVKHRQGNLLMRYGLERHREPGQEERGSTCYRWDDGDQHLAMWGFGVFYGTRRFGGLLIRRYGFRPVWSEVESLSVGIHSPDDLPTFARPRRHAHWRRAHRLCRDLMLWIADYEEWVQQQLGPEYRERCLIKWMDPVLPATMIASAWRILGTRSWEKNEWIGIRNRLRLPGARP